MIVAVGSAHGAPGATALTVGLAAAWPVSAGRERLVLEADGDGGVLAGRFDDLRADRTLADVAVEVRRGFDLGRVLACARRLWGSVPVVVAPPSAEQTQSALAVAAEGLAVGLAAAEDVDVVVDVGRVTSRSPALPLARRAALTLLVSRSRFEDVACLTTRVAELRRAGCEVGIAVVGDRPYSPVEVADACGAPLVASLPSDSRSAGVLAGGAGSDRHLRRSLLWRTISELASRLAAQPTAAAADPTATPAARFSVTDVAETARPATSVDGHAAEHRDEAGAAR